MIVTKASRSFELLRTPSKVSDPLKPDATLLVNKPSLSVACLS